MPVTKVAAGTGATAFGTAELARLLGDWRDTRSSLVDSLTEALIDLINVAVVPAGVRLPTQRALAQAIGVSRGTVTTAYQILIERGYAQARERSRTWVQQRSQWQSRPGANSRLASFGGARTGLIDLTNAAVNGLPLVGEAIASLDADTVNSYLPTDGYFPAGIDVLRDMIAGYHSAMGAPTSAEQILVTSGAQQAIWLIAHTLTGPGELVVTEDPTYRGALEAFTGAGAHMSSLPLRQGGIDLDLLRREVSRSSPVLLYVQPTIHNPTGSSMGHSRRVALAEIAVQSNVLTVEDCCSAELSLWGSAPVPGLAGLVDTEQLLTIGTMSKLFWAGLRVGWIRSSAALVKRLTLAKKSIDLAGSVIDQLIAVRLLSELPEARRQRLNMLRASFDETCAAIDTAFPHWTWDTPAGGSGLWIDTHSDISALVARARSLGIRFTAGPEFSIYDGFRQHIRLPFGRLGIATPMALHSLSNVAT